MPTRLGIEIRALFHEINDGLHWYFIVAANGEIILRFALARAFEDQRCHAARQERRFIGIAFLFGRVEADRHHHNRRLFVPAGLRRMPASVLP